MQHAISGTQHNSDKWSRIIQACLHGFTHSRWQRNGCLVSQISRSKEKSKDCFLSVQNAVSQLCVPPGNLWNCHKIIHMVDFSKILFTTTKMQTELLMFKSVLSVCANARWIYLNLNRLILWWAFYHSTIHQMQILNWEAEHWTNSYH